MVTAVSSLCWLAYLQGFWTRFFPAVNKMQEVLKAGTLGKINFLHASFCIPAATVPRMKKRELGGGALMDVGCYLVQYANLVFHQQPEKIVVVGELTEEGESSKGLFIYRMVPWLPDSISQSVSQSVSQLVITSFSANSPRRSVWLAC